MSNISRAITIHQPRQVEIGAGAIDRLTDWARDYAQVLVIATKHTVGYVERLKLAGNISIYDDIPAEPDTVALDAALTAATNAKPDLVIGLGGGSVMDVAKLVAALWDGDQSLDDVVGPNRVAGRRTALAQIATTSGTGSEAGTRALITDRETHAKKAVESPFLLADIAILDPELTVSVPPAVTAATGIDAMAHCVEAFTNIRAHDLIDGYARMGMNLVGKYLVRAVKDGSDLEARTGMMLASYYGGICLGPVNTAAGHALSYPLGTQLNLPHGLANAIIFPHVLAYNLPVRREKTAEIQTALGLSPATDETGLRETAHQFCENLGVEMRLSAHGATKDVLPAWADEAHAIRRLMDNNPRDMSREDVLTIYRNAF
jgi:alcohol dehydrogenase class IV